VEAHWLVQAEQEEEEEEENDDENESEARPQIRSAKFSCALLKAYYV
jgi:hypothetical protein